MNQLRLNKSGQIYLPNFIRNKMKLVPGDNLFIYRENQDIILSKEGCLTENQCILSSNGTLHIPNEIRKMTNIKSSVVFNVSVQENEYKLILSPKMA
ncbi:bifunctional DNA-binding transcriptional regulator/antitoxin component of YhaV-PrlF toxin-antitoxin module [Metabacillus malikii]|uniref:Bifunctional DNA-binding transcriptional regulator/antitoxin component of YhaV-PrlF toxin-antitoxin module n=1 Tax=Metabacillus malikii TaxID=1504265 RepID=A0ABT9ZDF2_9BACI|nr:bifunctional DNA-binding transcriptional regulator/antitoxin component of YhaV-PrlF toxin-antitoxin module [Metabacillus malikii]